MKWTPTAQNFQQLINAICNKEIIQKPKYVIDCWSSILFGLMQEDEYEELHHKCLPTVKNVLPLLNTNPIQVLDSAMVRVFGFMKKFEREANEKVLSSFLSFTTGVDIITTPCIIVDFSSETGLKGTPVGHTCTCTCSLELRKSYLNFTEFRSEMTGVLASGVWAMDML